MDTIIYILKKRSKYFLDKENQAEHILILLNMFAFSYIPKLLHRPLQLSDGALSLPALYLINNIIFFAPILSLFFPNFDAKKNMLPGYLPTPKWKLFLLDFISSLGKRPALSIIAMVVGFFVYFHFTSAWVWFSIILTGLIALLFIDALTNVLTWRKHQWWPVLAAAAGLILLPKYVHAGLTETIIMQLSAIFLLCVTVWNSYLISLSRTNSKKITAHIKGRSLQPILFSVIARHNMAIKAIALFFILKIIILFVMPCFGNAYQPGSQLPITILLFFSPVFLFASIFNNSFGYFRDLFLNIWLFNNRPGKFLRLFFTLLLPFLLVDILVSMTFLICFKLFVWQNIITYFSSTIYLIIVSMLSSCLFSKKIAENTLSGRQKATSTWSSLISMLPILIVTVLHLKQTYPTQLICLGMASITLLVFTKLQGTTWQSKVIHSIR